jgi:hypothetical protein
MLSGGRRCPILLCREVICTDWDFGPPEISTERLHFDYAQSVKEIYNTVVEFIVQKTGKLDVSRFARYSSSEGIGVHQRPTGTTGLPSWAPDWSSSDATQRLVESQTEYRWFNSLAKFLFG